MIFFTETYVPMHFPDSLPIMESCELPLPMKDSYYRCLGQVIFFYYISKVN